MQVFFAPRLALAAALVSCGATLARADGDATVRSADTTLREIMAISNNQIPASLLAKAEGVAIIPNVIKVGFVAGIRRGHGVVVVRSPDRGWSVPQFITLTGGSLGWQAGVSGTDVILVFMTKKSVEGLLNGKFTIGADAAAAAGPVGRNAAAATDMRLAAEILSYSRSRGLFVGVSLDGSAIEIDPAEHAAYYVGPPGTPLPESAATLLANLDLFSRGGQPAGMPAAAPVAVAAPIQVPTGATSTPTPASTKTALATSADRLYAVIDDTWRRYLALPGEVFRPADTPTAADVQRALEQYDRVARDPKYQALTVRSEFVTTFELLSVYAGELSATSGRARGLPPPPTGR